MNQPIIKVENLSKKYIIGHQNQTHYRSFRELLTGTGHLLLKKFTNLNKFETLQNVDTLEEFWALKDISFEVNQGDRVGIIGRNGAGKSTLLKILSRITCPTEGRLKIKGRVASLLEVGTGFHPELTGRENIFLNSAILGMSKVEIKKKFDEIVNFSEIEKFLDTPVKRYSSGMYVRLAFAVAAHLEPEILIVDEVLAVGDVQFQKKCLGKMEDVSKKGRTILFVSHNFNAIKQLCDYCILLDKGKLIVVDNNIDAVIKNFFYDHHSLNIFYWENKKNQFDNEWFQPTKLYFTDEKENRLDMPVPKNKDVWINIEGIIKKSNSALTIGYSIFDEENHLLYWTYQTDTEENQWPKLKKGGIRLISKLPSFFNEATYKIYLLSSLHFQEWICDPNQNTAPYINLVIQGGLSKSPYWIIKRPGALAPILAWENKNG